ncbi:MAG: carboxypeptidase-like regulatory domain-containing protein [Planctomycetota bacterium]
MSVSVGPMGTDTVSTGADGGFRLSHLRAGEIVIHVDAEGFLLTQETAVLDAGRPAIVVRLHRGGLLKGRIVDADGAPVPGAEVHVFDPKRRSLPNREDYPDTTVAGEFVTRLMPGTYTIEVWKGRETLLKAEAVLEEGRETAVDLVVPVK